jgi:hypothetical protein
MSAVQVIVTSDHPTALAAAAVRRPTGCPRCKPARRLAAIAGLLVGACAFAHPATAAVTATSQASLQVSAFVVSDCRITTMPILREADITGAVRIACAGNVVPSVGAARVEELPDPPRFSADTGVTPAGVLVVTY